MKSVFTTGYRHPAIPGRLAIAGRSEHCGNDEKERQRVEISGFILSQPLIALRGNRFCGPLVARRADPAQCRDLEAPSRPEDR